ncbi:hypothetical protein B0T26DRAFT_616725, partial [Lasiosphaeria miniovina]
MSSRLTTPVSKFTRSISSTASTSRPSNVLNNSKNKPAASASATTTAAGTRKRQARKAAAEEPAAEIGTRHHSTRAASPHRPTPPSAARKMPLMQGFRTSAPRPAAHADRTMDLLYLPNLQALANEETSRLAEFVHVPLLPDNTSPPPGTRLPEALDAPLAAPQILVVAANPDTVLPAALTEVEGMGVDGVELRFAHHGETSDAASVDVQGGMLRDLWKGLMDDVFGGPGASG